MNVYLTKYSVQNSNVTAQKYVIQDFDWLANNPENIVILHMLINP